MKRKEKAGLKLLCSILRPSLKQTSPGCCSAVRDWGRTAARFPCISPGDVFFITHWVKGGVEVRGKASPSSQSLGWAYRGKQLRRAHGTSSTSSGRGLPTGTTSTFPKSSPLTAQGHATQLPDRKKSTEQRSKWCEISVYIFACVLKDGTAEMCQLYSGR